MISDEVMLLKIRLLALSQGSHTHWPCGSESRVVYMGVAFGESPNHLPLVPINVCL
jgi:hypothetical protein